MTPDPYKRVVSGILDAFERIAYVAIALALSVPIVMLVFSAALSMLEVSEVGVLETSLTVLDRVLLAFIFVELIDTVRVTVRERGVWLVSVRVVVWVGGGGGQSLPQAEKREEGGGGGGVGGGGGGGGGGV